MESGLKLLPCPMCGGHAYNVHYVGSAWFVDADHDEACHFADFKRTEADAVTAWNTRTRAPSDAALVEALEAIANAPAWGAPDRWDVTPSEVRQLARAALAAAKGQLP